MSKTTESFTAATLLEIESTVRELQSEVRALRRSNEIIGAQLDVVETFRAALIGPRRGQGMSEDVTFKADQLLRKLVNFPTYSKETHEE